jgi:N6-L-threonylcarbamoyladenine synthase
LIVLGIETSCDETSVAIVNDGQILSNIIFSQIDLHREFGGVVPEVAARNHCSKLPIIFHEALKEAQMALAHIEGIAVTCKPGLIGALLSGITFGKGLAFAAKIPIKGIDHLEAHFNAVTLEKDVPYPFIALLVSGGHTALYRVEGLGQYQMLGRTVDDAAGEAFDKVARIMQLGYPGGPVIDHLAQSGNERKYAFPRPMISAKNFNFSFSGLKTAVQIALSQSSEWNAADVAASFNKAVADVLAAKTIAATESSGLKTIVVAGGVACNQRLRQTLLEATEPMNIQLHFPSPSLCTDNAAMVAHLGEKYLQAGIVDDLSFDASARSSY